MANLLGGKSAILISTVLVTASVATLVVGYVEGWWGHRGDYRVGVTVPAGRWGPPADQPPPPVDKDDPTRVEEEKPDGRSPFVPRHIASLISDVMSEHTKVITTASDPNPLANFVWKSLRPGHWVRTEEDGQALLRFKSSDCTTGFRLFRKSGYVRSNCSKKDLLSGNNHCVEYGTAEVGEAGCRAPVKVFTAGLVVNPTGTDFAVNYQPEKQLTMVTVNKGSVEVTPVLSLDPFRLSDAQPLPVAKGLCVVNTIDGAPSVSGVSTMTPVRGAACRPFVDKKTGDAIDKAAKANGIRVTPPPAFRKEVEFGKQVVGLAAVQEIEYRNDGFLTAEIDRILVEGAGDFVKGSVGDCAGKPVPSNESCALTVTFTPRDRGERSARLVIYDNTEGSPHYIPLKGTGVGDVPMSDSVNSFPRRLGFGAQEVGATSEDQGEQWAFFTNTGVRPITFAAPKIEGDAGAEFEVSHNYCDKEVRPWEQCKVGLKFKPRVAQERMATLSMTALRPALNGGKSEPNQERVLSVALAGRGLPPTKPVLPPGSVPGSKPDPSTPGGGTSGGDPTKPNTLVAPALEWDAPASECFGVFTPVKAKADKVRGKPLTVTVKNTGGGLLMVKATVRGAAEDYKLTNGCAGGVEKGKACQITVDFSPKASGKHEGTLVVETNDQARPIREVKLNGRGKSRCWLFRQLGKLFGSYKKPCGPR